MSTIRITALHAFAPVPGMVGALTGRPPIEEVAADGVEDALAKSAALSDRLKTAGVSHVLTVRCEGRKPRGFDAHVWSIRRSWVAGEASGGAG